MSGTSLTAEPQAVEEGSRDYVRFILLSNARTGSNMLAQALQSNSQIICFWEIFNHMTDFIAYNVEGYDNLSATDRALRDGDYKAFLRERIYCRHAPETRAVGFKVAYTHFWGFTGLRDRLAEDTEIRVLHLKRRNLLRSLVSLKIAQGTNIWVEDRKPVLTLANVLKAARDPLKAASRLWQRLASPIGSSNAQRPQAPVNVSAGELFHFIVRVHQSATLIDDGFHQHPKLTLFYEDMLDERQEVFSQAQVFLGVEPKRLRVTLHRQNPEPLRELIENYDELRLAFKDTPHAAFFD